MLPTSQKMMFSKLVITGCSFSIKINVSNVPVSTGSSSEQAFTIIYIYLHPVATLLLGATVQTS